MALSSVQKGKAVESLIATNCILGSNGTISVSVPLVDDEGVDLIFTPKGGGRSIFVQVKSRFILYNKGVYKTQINKKNFLPREDLYFIFAYYDRNNAQLGDTLWFISSNNFKKKLENQTNKDKYVFQSTFSSDDMWLPHKLKLKNLPQKIIELFKR